jgi:hypothetical protein
MGKLKQAQQVYDDMLPDEGVPDEMIKYYLDLYPNHVVKLMLQNVGVQEMEAFVQGNNEPLYELMESLIAGEIECGGYDD